MLRLYIHGLSPGLFSIMQNLLEDVDETVECFQSVFCTFIYSGVLEYLAEDFSYFLLQNIFDVVRVDIRIIWKELVYPVRVLEDAGVYKYTPKGLEAFHRFISVL